MRYGARQIVTPFTDFRGRFIVRSTGSIFESRQARTARIAPTSASSKHPLSATGLTMSLYKLLDLTYQGSQFPYEFISKPSLVQSTLRIHTGVLSNSYGTEKIHLVGETIGFSRNSLTKVLEGSSQNPAVQASGRATPARRKFDFNPY